MCLFKCDKIKVKIRFNRKDVKMKKCCMSCAFCQKEVKYNIFGIFVPNNNDVFNLTLDESKSALNGDFSFMDKEKVYYDNWHEEYKEKKLVKEKENEIAQKQYDRMFPSIAKFSAFTNKFNSKLNLGRFYAYGDKSSYDDYKDLGMTNPPPDDVEFTALSCYHKRWKSIKNTNINSNKARLVEENDCEFYYSLEQKGEKTLGACVKELGMLKHKRMEELKEEEINISKQALEMSTKALEESKETKQHIQSIATSVSEAMIITKDIAEYTKTNQKSASKQFYASIIISIIALLIAIFSFISSCKSSSNIENSLNTHTEQNKEIIEILENKE